MLSVLTTIERGRERERKGKRREGKEGGRKEGKEGRKEGRKERVKEGKVGFTDKGWWSPFLALINRDISDIKFVWFTFSSFIFPIILQSCNWQAVAPNCPSFTSLFYFLDSTYHWYHIVLVFFWLIVLSVIPSRFIHVIADGKISFFFYGWVVFRCIYTPYLLYPFVCWWTLRLLPYLSSFK